MQPVLAASVAANIYFGVFLVVAAFGFVFGFFTERGSAIHNHPWSGYGEPGARLPDEFHQFADRQVQQAARRAAWEGAVAPEPTPAPAVAAARGEMTIDEMNRRLAAEANARKEAREREAAGDVADAPPR